EDARGNRMKHKIRKVDTIFDPLYKKISLMILSGLRNACRHQDCTALFETLGGRAKHETKSHCLDSDDFAAGLVALAMQQQGNLS
ncbi:hypothetical protein U1Q18_051891, partial [Sarracenia purpurea var. burkii]